MDPIKAWIDGRVVPSSRPVVPADDRGLLLGDGVFETLRVYSGRPFLAKDHAARLRRSAKAIGLPVPRVARLHEAMMGPVLANGVHDGAVRVTLTAGSGPPGVARPARLRPRLIATASRLPPGLAERRERGVAVITATLRRARGTRPAGVKALDYLPAVLGKREAADRGAFEALFFTGDGELVEGATSNVFLVRDGRLATPRTETGLLAGITRREVLRLARRDGLPVAERRIRRPHIAAADEMFLTASVQEVVPIVRVDGRRVGRGAPGPVTRRIQAAYAARIERFLSTDDR